MKLSEIFKALGFLHTVTGWDPAVGDAFTKIGEALAPYEPSVWSM